MEGWRKDRVQCLSDTISELRLVKLRGSAVPTGILRTQAGKSRGHSEPGWAHHIRVMQMGSGAVLRILVFQDKDTLEK